MKRRKYGKTTKQWDNLYKKYKDYTKNVRNLSRLNKTEFIEAYNKKGKNETVWDIAKKTRTESQYTRYEREYKRYEKRGYQMGEKLSKRAFEEQIEEYSSFKELTESQFFTSIKQAENYVRHARQMGIDATVSDFYKENEKSKEFWKLIEAAGGWEAAFEY